MRIRLSVVAILFAISLGIPLSAQRRINDIKPTVIMVAIDGFRHDYIDRINPPAISRLARRGVRSRGLIPSFPTKTFPNFYTIVTGLYPANHGIVDNSFYDGERLFRYTDIAAAEDPAFWLGEPIWATAEKQGQRASAYFYPGSTTKIAGALPTTYRRFNGRVPNEMRVDKLAETLDAPVSSRATFLTLYFSDVDDAAHEFGPESEEVRYAVLNVDRSVQRLLDALRMRGIEDRVNIILVSDHGLTTVEFSRTALIDDYIDKSMLARPPIMSRVIWQIYPKKGNESRVVAKLADMKGGRCWERNNIPGELKYSGSERIAPVFCVADLGWQFLTRESYETERRSLDLRTTRGDHGYDNRHRDMHSLFAAVGPSFRRGFVAERFENVHIYNLMCKILGLTPAPNDGRLDAVKQMLR